MAMTKQETAQSMRKVANFLKGLIEAADDVEAIGSIENATREATEQRAQAEGSRDAVRLELEQLQATIAESASAAAAAAASTIEGATQQASALLADAEERSQAEARAVVNQAITDAADIRAKASAELDKANYDLDAAMRRRAEVLIELTDLESVLASLRSEHDALATSIADIKAKFA